MSQAVQPQGVTRSGKAVPFAATEDGRSEIGGYDPNDDMLKVKSVQKKFRDNFIDATALAQKWVVSPNAGAIAVAPGALTLSSGIVANNDTSILSVETFTIPFRVQVAVSLSQRIANQSFIVEAVSVDPATGIVDGLHSAGFIFDGTSHTQAKYRVQSDGMSPLESAASTVSSSASGSIYELEPFSDECWFHSGVLDSINGRAQSYRRHQQIPDPNALYKLRLRWQNASVAPATNSDAVIRFIACQDYAELTAEITAGRGQNVPGQALGVMIAGGQSAMVGPVPHDGARGSGAPIINGARAVSAAFASVATGDVTDLIATLQGVLITRPWQIPELEWSYAAASGGITNTADVILAAAAGAGLRRNLTSMTLSNSSATATEVVVKDGATVIWRGHLPGNAQNVPVNFACPLKSTANAALNFACVTAGAAVFVNAQGFTAA